MPTAAVRFVEIDRGWHHIRDEVRFLTARSIKVGIQSDAGSYDGGTDLADVAAFNEFGTSRIPSRPFMRKMADERRNDLYQVALRGYDHILAGGTATHCLQIVGQWYEAEQKMTLRNGPWPPNAPSTVRQKGSSRPLIDTARLLNAIRFAIVLGNGV